MLVRLAMGGELLDEEDDKRDLLNPEEIEMEFYYDAVDHIEVDGTAQVANQATGPLWLEQLVVQNHLIRNRMAHERLRNAIFAHIWNRRVQSIILYIEVSFLTEESIATLTELSCS